jgi:endogenous inhibitor of DNA gyrase (YacG/DUF329 family)
MDHVTVTDNSILASDRSAQQRLIRSRMRQAEKTGTLCGYCGRELSGDERVTLCGRINRQNRCTGVAPVCGDCMALPAREQILALRIIGHSGLPIITAPCAGCHRPLVLRLGVRRKHIYCSDRCYGRIVRPAVAHATVPCAVCGVLYNQTRADSRFCSGRCRQKAYRRRSGNDEE